MVSQNSERAQVQSANTCKVTVNGVELAVIQSLSVQIDQGISPITTISRNHAVELFQGIRSCNGSMQGMVTRGGVTLEQAGLIGRTAAEAQTHANNGDTFDIQVVDILGGSVMTFKDCKFMNVSKNINAGGPVGYSGSFAAIDTAF